MSTPYTLQATLSFPRDAGQPECVTAYSTSGQFDHKSDDIYKLTGAGTKAVDLSTMPFVKAALIKVAADALAPVNLIINGGADTQEVSPGGSWVYSNPSPSAGITALDLVHTMDAEVSVTLLG